MVAKLAIKINIFFGVFGILGGIITFIVFVALKNYHAGKYIII